MSRSLDGNTQKIAVSTFNVPANPTLSVWLNCSSLTNNFSSAYLGIIGQSNGLDGFQILLKSTGKFAYYATNGLGSGVSIDPGTATISLNTWVHVVFIYAASGLVTYVNAVSDGTKADANNCKVASMNFGIGYDPNTANRNFPGLLADGALWNVALTLQEVTALKNGARPKTVRPASLLRYWPLDGLQSPEPDLSGNGFNGTLTGTTLGAGPPVMMFTSRWPMNELPSSPTTIFRKTASRIGTRSGTRQTWAA